MGRQERVLASSTQPDEHVKLALLRNFEFKLPLAWLLATRARFRTDGGERKPATGREPRHQQASAAFQPVAEPACRWIRCRWKGGSSCRW